MQVLFIGDIVGPEATTWVAQRVPRLRQDLGVDLVIANGENCALTAPDPSQGFGMTRELVDLLLQNGVDVITSGNHAWDGPDVDAVHREARVLRPHNFPPDVPGKGLLTLDINGEPVTVLNLWTERGRMPGALPVYPTWLAAEKPGTVIIDFHGDSAWEKMIFATAIDGNAAAVLGTHTHEATQQLHILPNGTGFVADVGMTAPTGSPGGFPLLHFAAEYRGEDPSVLPPFALATGPIALGAVWLHIEGGKTVAIKRIA